MSQAYTQAALQDIDFFRSRFFGQFEHQATDQAVNADNNSSNKTQHRVAGRLTGLLADGRANGQAEDIGLTPTMTKIFAHTFSGRENILEEISFRRNLRSQVDQIRSDRMAWLSAPFVFIGSYSIFRAVSGSRWWLHLTDLAVAAEFIYVRHWPEEIIRRLDMQLRTLGSEDFITTALKNIGPGQWAYRSFDIKIPMKVTRDIWQTSEVDQNAVHSFAGNYSAPVLSKNWLDQRLAAPSSDTATDNSWLRVDEALSLNPGTQEPELITAVRLQDKIPFRPRLARQPFGQLRPAMR